MLRTVEPAGVLIHACGLPGQGRADNVYPTNPNAIQVSRERWLVVYEIRGLRGTDDQRSVACQLRAGAVDGPVLREMLLAEGISDWEPLDDGKKYERQHGSPVAFGVPRGATVNGRAAPHGNVFVIKWRRNARVFDRDGGFLCSHNKFPELWDRTMRCEWMQVRLNDAEDDLEVIAPARMLRQRGYEQGEAHCALGSGPMNQTFVQPAPLNTDCTEWADVCHSAGMGEGRSGQIFATRFRFNAELGLYEWVETGPPIGPEHGGLGEASLAPYNGSWVIAARTRQPGPIAWMRTDDPFARQTPAVAWTDDVYHNGPISVFRCADGGLRLFTGDKNVSPHANGRNPLYCWEINPDNGFRASRRRVVLDTLEAGLPFPIIHEQQCSPIVDYAKVFPHAGGDAQIVACRVRTNGLLACDPDYYTRLHRPTAAEIDASAVYYFRLRYDAEHPAQWRFANPSA